MNEFAEFTKISLHNHFGNLTKQKNADRTKEKSVDDKIVFDFTSATNTLIDAKKHQFNLLAFTNSNIFLLEEYICLKKMGKLLGITIIPGIEMNIIKENNSQKAANPKILHTVVLFNPNCDLIIVKNKIEKILNQNQECYFTIEDLIEIVSIENTNSIIIPHGIKQKKTNRSASKNIEQFVELIAFDDAIPVLIEDNKRFHKKQLLEEIKYLLSEKDQYWVEKTASVSSADRLEFSKISEPTYIWGENNYSSLYYSSIIKKARIKKKNDITIKSSYIRKMEIIPKRADSQIQECTIYCSHGLNSIIGKSGSGKTLLLNAIKRCLTGKNLEVKISSNNAYDEIYNDIDIILYDSNDKIINVDSKWNVFEGENLYNKILEVYKSNKTTIIKELDLEINDDAFENIIKKFNEDLNTYIKNSIVIKRESQNINTLLNLLFSNIKFLDKNVSIEDPNLKYLVDKKIETEILKTEKIIKEIFQDINRLDSIFLEIKLLTDKYNFKRLNSQIEDIKTNIKNQILKKSYTMTIIKLDLKRNIYIQENIYKIISLYNSELGDKLGRILKKQQENLEIIEDITNKIETIYLLKKNNYIPILKEETLKKSLKLKNNEIAKLYIKNIILKFDRDHYLELFDENIGASPKKVKKSLFKNLELDLNNLESIKEFLSVFIEDEYNLPLNLSYDYDNYIQYEIKLLRDNNKYENIENLSAGELAKTYISNMLDKKVNAKGSSVIVLFDQPDNNLEKTFILKDLSDKIDKLRNQYQVFITTHEPLLVVNADSNNIIEAVNDKLAILNKNKISYKNLSFFKTPYTKEKMVEEIAKLVDGSPTAISERNRIYGGMLNED